MSYLEFLYIYLFLACTGTWQTYIVKNENVWHKIEKGVPMEYAATITVNPLTALLMLEHCVTLNSGTFFFYWLNFLYFLFVFKWIGILFFLDINRRCYCAKWGYQHGWPVCHSACQLSWHSQH